MKKIAIYILIFLAASLVGYFGLMGDSSKVVSSNSPTKQGKEKPLDKYSFEKLSNIKIDLAKVKVEEVIKEEDEYTSYLFSFLFEGKTITGQMNIPNLDREKFPAILMIRGYIDPESYETGDGTRNAAAYFTKNGFVTIAPDFLGYGGSDDPDDDTFAARVKRPKVVMELLKGLSGLEMVDDKNVFMWGHSNGGQIALSVLEIIGESDQWQGVIIPTVLWAPVSKPFPYSILFYTDEYSDRGKALRKTLARFEEDYDVDLYSIHAYYGNISSPIQIHQGTDDDAVPKEWSDELSEKLEVIEKEVEYFVYPGADHNLRPSWDTVVSRNLTFFNEFLVD